MNQYVKCIELSLHRKHQRKQRLKHLAQLLVRSKITKKLPNHDISCRIPRIDFQVPQLEQPKQYITTNNPKISTQTQTFDCVDIIDSTQEQDSLKMVQRQLQLFKQLDQKQGQLISLQKQVQELDIDYEDMTFEIDKLKYELSQLQDIDYEAELFRMEQDCESNEKAHADLIRQQEQLMILDRQLKQQISEAFTNTFHGSI